MGLDESLRKPGKIIGATCDELAYIQMESYTLHRFMLQKPEIMAGTDEIDFNQGP